MKDIIQENIEKEEDLPYEIESLHKAAVSLLFKNRSLKEKNQILIEEYHLLEHEQHLLTEGHNLLLEEKQFLMKQLESMTDQLNALKEQLLMLKAKRFGKSSEKLDKKIGELELSIEEVEIEQSTTDEDNVASEDTTGSEGDKSKGDQKERSSVKNSKKRPKRSKLPDNLAREDKIIPCDTRCSSCGGEKFRKISDDISEVLEYVPASFKVIRQIRPRCACVNCEHIMQAPAPGNTIDKGKAGPGLLAHVIIQKYLNHLPLYRQSQIYEREGIEIARSTMGGWVGGCARLLEPLWEELKKAVFSASHIHWDDTPVKVLEPGSGKTKTGRIWVYLRDGRPWGDESPGAVCYFYSPDRKGERPLAHLKDFCGTLHADAYSGYNGVYNEEVSEAGCWAHLRRKFYEVTVVSDNAKVACEILEEIGKIYKIEELIRGKAPDERLNVRQEESKNLVEKLFANMQDKVLKLPKKSMTLKAINYGLNNKDALLRFLSDGKVEIDNNAAERALRAIAVGRKNWLFAGSDSGGETAAVFYSLLETAKLNNINPWIYLRQVLATIQDYNSQKIADLLPWNIVLDETG